MQIILSPYIETSDSDWAEYQEKITSEIRNRLTKWEDGKLKYDIRQTNHGLGADWPTITIDLLSIAIFAIPEAHKRVRESIEELPKIKASLERLLHWVSPKKQIVSYPIELLYLDALGEVLKNPMNTQVTFLSASLIPVDQNLMDGASLLKHYLFVFDGTNGICLVAVSSSRELLWSKEIAKQSS